MTVTTMQDSILIRIFLFFTLAMSAVAATAQIDRAVSQEILQALESERPASFADFLESVGNMSSIQDAGLRQVVSVYPDISDLDQSQSNTLYRLLGIYTRLKYGQEAIETLTRLVAIPTFRVEGVEQHDNPEFHRFAALLASLAGEFDLAFRNVDDRVYEVSLDGTGDELVAIHAHADVVPVNPELWVLENGTRLDPFRVTRVGDRLYGRGTEDDKNGIVVSLYAMRVIREEGLPLLRDFRLLVDTTEETLGNAIPYYFERNPVPDYNIAVDGSYPVVIAEKGYGTVMAHFPVRRASGEGAEIIGLVGGLATNQIPSTATALIRSARPAGLLNTLNEEGARFVSALGGDFGISARQQGNAIRLDVTGVSAHSSDPESGINPVSRLFAFIHELHQQGLFQNNHVTDAAAYATENWGLDYYGNELGVAYADDFMGPLTTSQTFIALDDEMLRTAVNLRLPIGRVPEELLADIEGKLTEWSRTTGVEVRFDLSAAEPMYRNPEGAWVNALLDIAVENLEMPRVFGSSGGATSIHSLPNGVQFGLSMPTEKYTGHNANEFKRVEQFLVDMQIITEMFARLGRMPSLQDGIR